MFGSWEMKYQAPDVADPALSGARTTIDVVVPPWYDTVP